MIVFRNIKFLKNKIIIIKNKIIKINRLKNL